MNDLIITNQKIKEIAHQTMTLSRNTLLVNMRFIDAALSKLKLFPAPETTLATDGQYLFYNPHYVIRCYKDEQEVMTRNYLHVILHCVFRHMFIHSLMDKACWDLACDIAVEFVITGIGAKSTASKREIKQKAVFVELQKQIKLLTAEKIYRYYMDQNLPAETIIELSELFCADDHFIWYLPSAQRNSLLGAGSNQDSGDDNRNSDGEDKTSDEDDNRNSGGEDKTSDEDDNRNSDGEDKTSDEDDNRNSDGEDKTSDEDDNRNSDGEDKISDEDDNRNSDGEDKTSDEDDNRNSGGEGKTSDEDDNRNSDGEDKTSDEDDNRNSDGEDKTSDEGDNRNSGGEGKNNNSNVQDDVTGNAKQRLPDFAAEADWTDIAKRMQMDMDTFSKLQGKEAGGLIQNLAAVNREKYDYSSFLKKFAVLGEVMKVNDDEFDYIFYTYGLKLYDNMPLIEPLEYKETKRIREFVIAIDTSGSVEGETVQCFVQKTYNILKSTESFFSKINLHIIQCDAELQEDAKITSQEEFDRYIREMKLRGFGVTDFRPVFDYVDKLIMNHEFSNLRGLIYFTDGFGTFPEKMPDYNTAFVFLDDEYNNPNVPPWAIKLVLQREEIEGVTV